MWKWQCMIQWMESLPVFRQKLLKRLAVLSLWVWWFCLFFGQTLEEKLILQEVWELMSLEWTDMGKGMFHDLLCFSVHGIILVFFPSIILVKGRETLRNIRRVLIQNYIIHGNTGLFWFSEIFNDIRISLPCCTTTFYSSLLYNFYPFLCLKHKHSLLCLNIECNQNLHSSPESWCY